MFWYNENRATDFERLDKDRVASALDRLREQMNAGPDPGGPRRSRSAAPRIFDRAAIEYGGAPREEDEETRRVRRSPPLTPVLSTSEAGDSARARLGFGRNPGRPSRVEPRLTSPDEDRSDGEQSAKEQAIGQELTALIRSGDDLAPGPRTLVAPAPALPPARGRRSVGLGFRLRPAKVADLVGMLLTAAGIWAGYQWFQSLPERPSDSPWSHLGSARPAKDTGPTSLRSGRKTASASEQPLGRYVFNESWEQRAPEDRSWKPPATEHTRISALEAAFDAEYVPPAGCLDSATEAEMVRCANHRIRAQRAFLENGGVLPPEGPSTGEDMAYAYPPPLTPAYNWPREEAQVTYDDPAQPWSSDWQETEIGDGTWQAGAGPVGEPGWEADADPQGEIGRAEPAAGAAADTDAGANEGPDWRSPGDWASPRDWTSDPRGYPRGDQAPGDAWTARQDWPRDSAPVPAWEGAEDWRRQEYPPQPDGLREPDGYWEPWVPPRVPPYPDR